MKRGFGTSCTAPAPSATTGCRSGSARRTCTPSCAHSDGTSVSLLEAMASALPVLVTDISSNREWVAPGENGWLAPSGDAGAVAAALVAAAALDGEARREMGLRNRRVVEARADWGVNGARLLEAYDALAAGGA